MINITYDLMGNITALNRYQAGTQIDSLIYAYSNTNQLQSITDASGSNIGVKAGTGLTYAYDGNGNVTTDPSRNSGSINIAYNLLNLPQSITGAKTITYTYDADGNKLRRVSTGTGNTDYISGIEYDGTSTDTLNFIQTEEGRAVKQGSTYDYQYYLGDNLGNTRVTFGTKTGTAVLLQTDDYYPFGMEINRSAGSLKNEYLYNKKELQEELGQYDYDARFYDPVIARWNTIDPLAEISRRYSPYNYVENNPIRLIDPDGMETKTPEQYDQQYAEDKAAFDLGKRSSNFSGASLSQTSTTASDTTKHVKGGNSQPNYWEYQVFGKELPTEEGSGVEQTKNTLSATGTIFTILGYAFAIPSDGATLGLVALGSGFDAGSTAVSAGNDFAHGNIKGGGLKFGVALTEGLIGSKVEGMLNAVQEKALLGALIYTAGKTIDKPIEQISISLAPKKPINQNATGITKHPQKLTPAQIKAIKEFIKNVNKKG